MIQYIKSSIFSAEGQHMNDIMAIGIAGGTGSGKTTITRLLSERFGKDVSVIYYDNYYKAHDDLT